MDEDLRGLERELAVDASNSGLRFRTARTLARAERYNDAWTLMWDGYEFRTTEFWDKDVREFLSGVGSNLYKELEFEPRKSCLDDIIPYSADKSLARCVRKRYDGHPLSAQVFSFLIAEANGFLDAKNKKVAKSRSLSFEEWFGIAERAVEERVDKKKNKYVIYYECPQNFTYDEEHRTYDFSKMTFEKQRKFSLKGFKLFKVYSLSAVNKINPDLVLYHLSQQFENIPKEIENKTRVITPPNQIRCISAAAFNTNYLMYDCNFSASRGVRRIKLSNAVEARL